MINSAISLERDIVPWLKWLRAMGVDDLKGNFSLKMQALSKANVLPATRNTGHVDTDTMINPLPKTNILPMALNAVREELGECHRCKLSAGRKNIVFGSGNPHAALMFVGEGPGADEDQQGLPFVGKAGQLLTKMITAMGLTREEVYIANIVKCRPPNNRPPEEDEICACHPFLMKQIEAISPKVICALGTFAAQTLLSTKTRISDLRGEFHNLPDGPGRGIQVLPTFHPAYLLRNPSEKKKAWDDLQKIMQRLQVATPPAVAAPPAEEDR